MYFDSVFIVFDKTQESDESESEIDDEVSGHVLIMWLCDLLIYFNTIFWLFLTNDFSQINSDLSTSWKIWINLLSKCFMSIYDKPKLKSWCYNLNV